MIRNYTLIKLFAGCFKDETQLDSNEIQLGWVREITFRDVLIGSGDYRLTLEWRVVNKSQKEDYLIRSHSFVYHILVDAQKLSVLSNSFNINGGITSMKSLSQLTQKYMFVKPTVQEFNDKMKLIEFIERL